VAIGGLGVALLGWSYVSALREPDSPGWQLRTAEWVRDMHLGFMLDVVEWCVDSRKSEKTEAEEPTELSVFPPPFELRREKPESPREPSPIPISFKAPLPHEGEWKSIGWTINGTPTLRCTTFRPDAAHPNRVVAVARFTPELTRFVLVPGTKDPGGKWSWHGEIPKSKRSTLLAAFNAGFRLRDAKGGLYAEERVARRLVEGAASFVVDRNGAPDIIAWPADRAAPNDWLAVRQNLRLIVQNGVVEPTLEQNPGGAWGRLNHTLFIWRSGLGIARDGALLYVAGNGLTLMALAQAMRQAGAVRAMELDIHHAWPSFNVFQPKAANRRRHLLATKLMPSMRRPAERYLSPDDRDFVAAFVRD
jgi:hypothetical protein